MLGERTAEEVKMTLGSAFPLPDEPEAEIRGRDMVSGLPRTVVVSSAEVRQALEEPLHTIVDAVRTTLDQTPPELAGDIMDRGIVLTGGGALLRGLDERLRHETGMPVHVAEDPLTSVAHGRRQVRRGVRGLSSRSLVSGLSALTPTTEVADALPRRSRASREPRRSAARRAAAGLRARLITLDYHGGTGSPDGARPPRGGRGVRPGRGRVPRRVRPFTAVPDWFRTRSQLQRPDRHPARPQNSELRSAGRHLRLDRNRLAEYDGLTAAASTLGHALVPARVVGIGADPVLLPHGHHRRRLAGRRRART